MGVEALAHLVGDEQPRPRGERGTEQRELLLALGEISVWTVEQVGAVEAASAPPAPPPPRWRPNSEDDTQRRVTRARLRCAPSTPPPRARGAEPSPSASRPRGERCPPVSVASQPPAPLAPHRRRRRRPPPSPHRAAGAPPPRPGARASRDVSAPLPAPFPPSTCQLSPARTTQSTPRSKVASPRESVSPRISTTGEPDSNGVDGASAQKAASWPRVACAAARRRATRRAKRRRRDRRGRW